MALSVDILCVDAMEYLLDRHLMSVEEERTFLESLWNHLGTNEDHITTTTKSSWRAQNRDKKEDCQSVSSTP